MEKLYRTSLTVRECKDRLKNNLEWSATSDWNSDAFVGNVIGNKYKYYLHKAHMRNDFRKQVIGKIFCENNQTFVTAKLSSPQLSYFPYIGGLGAILYIISSLSNRVTNSLETVALIFLILSILMLGIGLVSISMPMREEKHEQLFSFIKSVLELKEVDDNEIIN